jgi:hypothetical protein
MTDIVGEDTGGIDFLSEAVAAYQAGKPLDAAAAALIDIAASLRSGPGIIRDELVRIDGQLSDIASNTRFTGIGGQD